MYRKLHKSILCSPPRVDGSNLHLLATKVPSAAWARFKSLAAVVDTATQAPKPEPGASPQQQFLRLPVDSARKLRYYDRPDLNELVTTHARDMATLQAANAALKKVRVEVVQHTGAQSHFAPPWSGLECDRCALPC
jgi:hypothetical protein